MTGAEIEQGYGLPLTGTQDTNKTWWVFVCLLAWVPYQLSIKRWFCGL